MISWVPLMQDNSYIESKDTLYEGVLDEVKMSGNTFQCLFEAFTNSLEAINLREDKTDNGSITIKIYSYGNLANELSFQKMVIEDNGIGFNEENFERFKMYKDFRKGFDNKGSGRMQLIHCFDRAKYESIYKIGTGYKKRTFTISKSKEFLDKNAIIFYQDDIDIQAAVPATVLTLTGLLKDENFFNELTAEGLKNKLISRYISYFCSHKEKLPSIKIEHHKGDSLFSEVAIAAEDIPSFDKEVKLDIYYSALAPDGKGLMKTANKEEFTLRAFKISKDKLEKNAIKLTSKDEIVDNVKIGLDLLHPNDEINGNKLLFLVSSPYIESRDSDVRGNIKIPSKEEYKISTDIFTEEQIFIEDIKDNVNSKVQSIYEEIKKKKEEHIKGVEELKSMFLISDDTLKGIIINLHDDEESILTKIYSAEAKNAAKRDAEIKKRIDELDDMDTTTSEYEENLESTISELVKQIPLQNRTALTHYVARRKLVLELFDKILKKKLKVQQVDGARQKDEKLLHNLIFQQTTTNPEKSDLWLINEDFIYFKGTSESQFREMTIDGETLFKDDLLLAADEKQFRKSLGEDRFQQRPDILLFPSEGKCIIIEFKSIDTNVSDHLTQINNYATLIRNFTKDEYQFTTFYGYLIGEGIEPNEVRAHDSDFIHSSHFDFLYRASKKVAGMYSGREDGSLYTEVIKYSTLHERAAKRNEIFVNKIMQPEPKPEKRKAETKKAKASKTKTEVDKDKFTDLLKK